MSDGTSGVDKENGRARRAAVAFAVDGCALVVVVDNDGSSKDALFVTSVGNK